MIDALQIFTGFQVVIATVSFGLSSLIATMVCVQVFPRHGSADERAASRAQNPNTRTRISPLKRILLGLSISEAVQSLALIMGPWAVPSDSSLTKQKSHSCKANGFLFALGSTAVPMYTFLLCTHYLCKVKWRMTNARFVLKVEKKAHAFIAVFILVISIMGLVMDSCYGTCSPSGTFCHFSSAVSYCQKSDEGDVNIQEQNGIGAHSVQQCDSSISISALVLIYVSAVSVPVICFFGIIGIMGTLWWYLIEIEKKIQTNMMAISRGNASFLGIRSGGHHDESAHVDSGISGIISGASSEVNENTLYPGQSRGSNDNHVHSTNSRAIREINRNDDEDDCRARACHLIRHYRKETIVQAGCYAVHFALTYIPIFIVRTIVLLERKPSPYLRGIVAAMCPLGGVFNVFIYTRPQVAKLKRRHPACPNFLAFYVVVKEGGEVKDDLNLEGVRCCCYKSGENLRNTISAAANVEDSESVSECPIGEIDPAEKNASSVRRCSAGCIHEYSLFSQDNLSSFENDLGVSCELKDIHIDTFVKECKLDQDDIASYSGSI